MRTNKIRLNESQLHRVIKESVKRVLMEDLYKQNTEIGDGTFPNPSAMIDDKFKRVEQALQNAGYYLVEYGDDIHGNGVAYFENDEGETVEITYNWNQVGKNSYQSGKVSDAYVYQSED